MPAPKPPRAKDGDVVDLTMLSSTMMYAEVYNIMMEPDRYIGKTIRMNRPYYASYFEDTEQYYHFVIIEDATACCQEGLEFTWKGDYKYPDDYPVDGTIIEISGVLESYDENGDTYYGIVSDGIDIVQ